MFIRVKIQKSNKVEFRNGWLPISEKSILNVHIHFKLHFLQNVYITVKFILTAIKTTIAAYK